MFCGIYIEALLVDEKLADQVWPLWIDGRICDARATIAWALIVSEIRNSALPRIDKRALEIESYSGDRP